MLTAFTALQTHVLLSDLCTHADVWHTRYFSNIYLLPKSRRETGGRKGVSRTLKRREYTKGGSESKVKGSE